jgi:uncharacterized protein
LLLITYIKLIALSLVQDSIIFIPHPRGMHKIKDPSEYGLPETQDKTLITQDGETIHYWIKNPSNKDKPYIVFFHGNAGHFGDLKSLTEKNNDRGYRLKLLHDFADKGYGFIAVSLRGYGKSTGKPSEDGFVKDVLAVTELIQKQNYNVVILGESLGAFSALTLMDNLSEKNISPKGVTLIAPFSDLIEKAYETDEDFRRFDARKYLKYRFDNKGIIAKTKYRGEILFIHPLEDNVSGVYHSKILEGVAIKNNIKTEMVVLKNAGHVTWNPDEVAKMITDKF